MRLQSAFKAGLIGSVGVILVIFGSGLAFGLPLLFSPALPFGIGMLSTRLEQKAGRVLSKVSAAVTGAAASVIAIVIAGIVAGIVYAVAAAAFVYWMRLTGENPVVQNQSFYNGVIVIVLLAVFAVGGGLGAVGGIYQVERGRLAATPLTAIQPISPSPSPADSGETTMPLRKKQSIARMILIICTVIWGLLLLPSLLWAGASLFLGEGIQGMGCPEQLVVFAMCSAWSLPLLIVVSLMISWALYFIRRYTAAVVVNLLPILSIGVIVWSWVLLGPYM